VEAIIADLLNRFEKGALSRRGLIQGLSMLAAGGAAFAEDAPGLKGTKIDHISIQVTDLPRAVAFYEKVFGLKVLGEDKANEIARLGSSKIIVSLHHKSPTGIVDHFAIGVENFDKAKVTAQLKAMGIEASDNLDAGFHIVDPEGMNVQIMPG
jgi:catechol 2,3-dioxygenase-like lactoylglutathione lyase family enzyme